MTGTEAVAFALGCSVLAFFAGVLVGIYWIPDKVARRIAQSINRLGQTRRVKRPTADPAQPKPKPKPKRWWRRVTFRTWAIMLLTLALLGNLVAGILLIVTRAEVDVQASNQAAYLACSQRFNERSGRANDARDTRAKEISGSSINLWLSVVRLNKAAAKHPTSTKMYLHQLFADVHTYIAHQRATQATRDNVPFPPPDMCTNLGKESH